jgi:hypothetical protein
MLHKATSRTLSSLCSPRGRLSMTSESQTYLRLARGAREEHDSNHVLLACFGRESWSSRASSPRTASSVRTLNYDTVEVLRLRCCAALCTLVCMLLGVNNRAEGLSISLFIRSGYISTMERGRGDGECLTQRSSKCNTSYEVAIVSGMQATTVSRERIAWKAARSMLRSKPASENLRIYRLIHGLWKSL